MKRLLIILLTISIFTSVSAQEPESNNRKNAIYLTAGTFFNNVNISYERMIWKPDRKLLNEVGLRGNVGWWDLQSRGGFYTTVTAQVLSAGEILRWDFGAGCTIRQAYFSRPSELIPTGNAGMRINNKINSVILRCGFGFPELLYFSLGFAF